jgi:hypothetical protein
MQTTLLARTRHHPPRDPKEGYYIVLYYIILDPCLNFWGGSVSGGVWLCCFGAVFHGVFQWCFGVAEIS